MKSLKNKIAEIISEYGLSIADVFTDKEKESIPTEVATERILTLLEQCPAMTIEDCPWGKENVEFREIFLRGMNRQLEGIEVEEECKSEYQHNLSCFCRGTGKIRRSATLEDIDLKDLINHYDYPCGKDHAPKTPTGGKLVAR